MALVNKDLENIFLWAIKNSLILNPAKSKMMFVGTKSQIQKTLNVNPVLKINDIVIPIEYDARNLGLIIDSEMRYVKHVNEKIKNAFYKLKVLYNIRKYISEEVRLLLCDLLVLSPFNYCSSVYGPRLWIKTESAIQRVQNACIRFCYSIPRRANIRPYLAKKGILNMKDRRELHIACITQKILWNKKPEYLFERFTWAKDSHDRHTRSKFTNCLAIPNHKTKGFKGCLKYQASKIWNNLPPPFRVKISSITFKKKVKILLLSRQSHMVETTFKL